MLDALARLLGLSRTDAEASLYSERAARHVLTRRSAIGLAGAMCAGTLLSRVPDAMPLVLRGHISGGKFLEPVAIGADSRFENCLFAQGITSMQENSFVWRSFLYNQDNSPRYIGEIQGQAILVDCHLRLSRRQG